MICPGFFEPHAVAPDGGVDERWARQALAGGYTTVCAFGTARRARTFDGACPELVPIGRLTEPGTRRLAAMADAAGAGAIAFGDGTEPHGDPEILRRGLLYAGMLQRPVYDLPRDPALGEAGVAAAGAAAEEMGLFGVPAAAETLAVRRGLELARAAKELPAPPPGGYSDAGVDLLAVRGRLHFTALSAAGSVAALREEWGRAKGDRAWVSAAVSAAHLLCTAEALRGFDPAGRVDPPFRDAADREALVELVAGASGTGPNVCVSAGHRPDPGLLDPVDLLAAPPGYEAFETAFSATFSALSNRTNLAQIVGLLTRGPAFARDVHLTDGAFGPASLGVGRRADAVLFDPSAEWTCDPAALAVPVARTPLAGKRLRGRVTHTILGGQVAFER